MCLCLCTPPMLDVTCPRLRRFPVASSQPLTSLGNHMCNPPLSPSLRWLQPLVFSVPHSLATDFPASKYTLQIQKMTSISSLVSVELMVEAVICFKLQAANDVGMSALCSILGIGSVGWFFFLFFVFFPIVGLVLDEWPECDEICRCWNRRFSFGCWYGIQETEFAGQTAMYCVRITAAVAVTQFSDESGKGVLACSNLLAVTTWTSRICLDQTGILQRASRDVVLR